MLYVVLNASYNRCDTDLMTEFTSTFCSLVKCSKLDLLVRWKVEKSLLSLVDSSESVKKEGGGGEGET